MGDTNLKILNLNIQGLGMARRGLKSTLFAANLPNINPDLFVITETHISRIDEIENFKKIITKYHITYALGMLRRNGVICGFRKSKFNVIDSFPDISGRLLLTRVRHKMTNKTLVILVVYAPTREGERIQFWREMEDFTNYNPGIVAGDFNCVLQEDHAIGGQGRHIYYGANILKQYLQNQTI